MRVLNPAYQAPEPPAALPAARIRQAVSELIAAADRGTRTIDFQMIRRKLGPAGRAVTDEQISTACAALDLDTE